MFNKFELLFVCAFHMTKVNGQNVAFSSQQIEGISKCTLI